LEKDYKNITRIEAIKSPLRESTIVTILIYCEVHENIESAIEREKEIKKWRREKKEKLIEEQNPDWRFMNNEIL